jgi:AcrR family transcriptional regulator
MVNVVQAFGSGLRGRSQRNTRRAFLEEAMCLVAEHGIEALTIKALAARLHCSVGALYRHFRSKDALISAMQAEAIDLLAEAHDRALPALDEALAALDDDTAELARLVAFGELVVAARHVHPAAFGLQQQLLSAAPLNLEPRETARVLPVAVAMMRRPTERIEAAQERGLLRPGAAFERALTWVAALGGVLQLANIRHPAAPLLPDADRLAHRCTLDLLLGWGADPSALQRAERTVSPQLAHDVLAATAHDHGKDR